jgi:hypothetical protein
MRASSDASSKALRGEFPRKTKEAKRANSLSAARTGRLHRREGGRRRNSYVPVLVAFRASSAAGRRLYVPAVVSPCCVSPTIRLLMTTSL